MNIKVEKLLKIMDTGKLSLERDIEVLSIYGPINWIALSEQTPPKCEEVLVHNGVNMTLDVCNCAYRGEWNSCDVDYRHWALKPKAPTLFRRINTPRLQAGEK